MNIVIDVETKMRASDVTERRAMISQIGELERKLRNAESYSKLAIDPQWARKAVLLSKEIEKRREALEAFDTGRLALAEKAQSPEADAARKQALRAAADFEKQLEAFASSATAMLAAAHELNDAIANREPGRWPHKHQTVPVIRARVLDVLSGAGLAFADSKATTPLTERFE